MPGKLTMSELTQDLHRVVAIGKRMGEVFDSTSIADGDTTEMAELRREYRLIYMKWKGQRISQMGPAPETFIKDFWLAAWFGL
jgi:hypothetical protein